MLLRFQTLLLLQLGQLVRFIFRLDAVKESLAADFKFVNLLITLQLVHSNPCQLQLVSLLEHEAI